MIISVFWYMLAPINGTITSLLKSAIPTKLLNLSATRWFSVRFSHQFAIGTSSFSSLTVAECPSNDLAHVTSVHCTEFCCNENNGELRFMINTCFLHTNTHKHAVFHTQGFQLCKQRQAGYGMLVVFMRIPWNCGGRHFLLLFCSRTARSVCTL